MYQHTEQRLSTLKDWLTKNLPGSQRILKPLPGDASFRRYFRCQDQERSLIIMDAPPEVENVRSFIAIAQAFANLGVLVPKILFADSEQGFLILTDLGDKLYQHILPSNPDHYYRLALDSLQRIQGCQDIPGWELTGFDAAFMRQELDYFSQWFIQQHLQIAVPEKLLNDVYNLLIAEAIAQPQLCIHRDYHSRNLMLLDNDQVGVLDFQDAMWGPATYDVVSLLRDCYISWSREQVVAWASDYWQQAQSSKRLARTVGLLQWLRWFDLMGIQRHLKAIFIFARKFHRDQNPGYLADIPRALNYVIAVSADYPELRRFREFLLAETAPLLAAQGN